MKKRTRWVLIGVAGAGALLAAGIGLSGSEIEVDAGRIERGTLRVAVTEEGRTRVRARYVVAAPVSGLLTRIALSEGDAVLEGAPLALIYPAPENAAGTQVSRAQVAAAQARRGEVAARVDEARARLARLERELARSRTLAEAGAIPRAALEDSELAATAARQQLEAAQASARAAEADVAAARAALAGARPESSGVDAVEAYAPSSGQVLRVLQKSRRVVAAGTPLIELGDAGQLEVVIDVLSEEAVAIRPGHLVLLEEWGGEVALTGSVRRVEPEAFTEVSALGVEEQRVNVIADLDQAPASLGAGYRVEASIVTWTGENTLMVPTSALFQRADTWQVFAVEDGKAALRAVRIGKRSSEHAEVEEGLSEGEQVILFPTDKIHAGVSVRAKPPSVPR